MALPQSYLLLVAGTVVVLVLDGLEKVHLEDLVEKRLLELSVGSSLLDRGESCGSGDEAEGKKGGSLHGWIIIP